MGGLRRLARKAIATLRSGGPRALFWQALALAGVRRLTVYRRPLADYAAPTPVPGVTIRPLTEADADAYRELRPGTACGGFERRIAAGDRCFGAWRDGRLIGVYWLATREARVPYLGLSVPLARGGWFVYDGFVAPQERFRGIHNVLRFAVVSQGLSEGATDLVSAVLRENRAAQELVRRSQPLGTLVSIRIGPLRLAHSSVPREYLGEPRFSDASPQDDMR